MKKHRHHPKLSWKLRNVNPKSELQCHQCGATIIPSEGGFYIIFLLQFMWCIFCYTVLFYMQRYKLLAMEYVAYVFY